MPVSLKWGFDNEDRGKKQYKENFADKNFGWDAVLMEFLQKMAFLRAALKSNNRIPKGNAVLKRLHKTNHFI